MHFNEAQGTSRHINANQGNQGNQGAPRARRLDDFSCRQGDIMMVDPCWAAMDRAIAELRDNEALKVEASSPCPPNNKTRVRAIVQSAETLPGGCRLFILAPHDA